MVLRKEAQYDYLTELKKKHSTNSASYAGVCPNRFFAGMALDTDVQAYLSNMEDVKWMDREAALEVTYSWFGI